MNRRELLLGAGAAGALSALSASSTRAQVSSAHARIVIAGVGAAGLSLASRLSRQMENATITIIDAKRAHHFQPGYTLIGAGLWQPSDVTFRNADFIPSGVEWIEESVTEFDPDANRVATGSGRVVDYDFLFAATGLVLDYRRIDGMDESLIGKDGIASIYAGPDAAAASFREIESFVDKGGVAIWS